MTPLDLARAFLAKAREDEALLESVLENPGISDAIFGFHAQQAAEKYLKAVLAIEQERPERTHDLRVLAEQCEAAGHELPETGNELARLSPYAVQERYPFAPVPPIDRQVALNLVAALRRWAEGLIDQ